MEPTGNVARIAIAVDYDGNGFRRCAVVALNDSALLNALLALSASHLHRLQGQRDTTSKMYLRRSFQQLNRRLHKPNLAESEVTLMTMVVLLSFEVGFHYGRSSGDAN